MIRDNLVVATGGSTVFGADADAVGIFVGPVSCCTQGVRVLNNDVIGTTKLGNGTAVGIQFVSAIDGLAVNNRITGTYGLNEKGIEYALASSGKFRDNIVSGVGNSYTGTGTNIGNNN